MIAITICATKNYTYAMLPQARRVLAAITKFQNVSKNTSGCVILSGDGSSQVSEIENYYKNLLPGNWEILNIRNNLSDDQKKNYKHDAQLVIAQLRTAAFTKALSKNVEFCWSLDSDVLPPANALLSLWQILQWDENYYGVSQAPYYSQGGGGLMGGRGTPQNHISTDFLSEERVIPEDLQKRIDAHKVVFSNFQETKVSPTKEWVEEGKSIDELVKKCSPKGNIFHLNSLKWRKRGWMESAYPAIGKGCVVPIDWCGFGCTLMSRKALELSFFEGYPGAGTEDLYICWHRWYPNGIRIAGTPHILCDHIVRDRNREGDQVHGEKYIHLQPYHETEGECIGHVRMRSVPWYSQNPGEIYDEKNDGKFSKFEEKSE